MDAFFLKIFLIEKLLKEEPNVPMC